MTGRDLMDCGRLKGCLSITVTFLHCQRPEMLGYFFLMWIFANQLFQSFGDILTLSILVSSLNNCSGSCYRCTKPLPPLSLLPSFMTVLKTPLAFKGWSAEWYEWFGNTFHLWSWSTSLPRSLCLQREHQQFMGAGGPSAHKCFPLYH